MGQEDSSPPSALLHTHIPGVGMYVCSVDIGCEGELVVAAFALYTGNRWIERKSL